MHTDKETVMPDHPVGTYDAWLAARRALLVREKELTRLSDEIAAQRMALPWVRVEKDYAFDTEDGPRTLPDLFDGRSQLLVYHFMFGPDWDAGCPSCSFAADEFDRGIVHLEQRDVTMICVSRAPVEKLAAYQRRMGWGSPGRRRCAATSTSTSASRSPRPSSATVPSTTSAGSSTRPTSCRA
jgi:predicted dithiol-disulfide oxidoreductase (DUF899 family)